MSMQKKVLASIQNLANTNGYEFSDNPSWANAGKVYISPVGSFENAIGFYYSFQDGYFTMEVYRGGHPVVGGMVPKSQPGLLGSFYIENHQAHKINAVLDLLRKHLPRTPSPAKA